MPSPPTTPAARTAALDSLRRLLNDRFSTDTAIREHHEKGVANSFLPAPIVGHVGDGNFHVAFVINPNDPAELAEAHRQNKLLVERALSMDGTCTGEHGIGLVERCLAREADRSGIPEQPQKADFAPSPPSDVAPPPR